MKGYSWYFCTFGVKGSVKLADSCKNMLTCMKIGSRNAGHTGNGITGLVVTEYWWTCDGKIFEIISVGVKGIIEKANRPWQYSRGANLRWNLCIIIVKWTEWGEPFYKSNASHSVMTLLWRVGEQKMWCCHDHPLRQYLLLYFLFFNLIFTCRTSLFESIVVYVEKYVTPFERSVWVNRRGPWHQLELWPKALLSC